MFAILNKITGKWVYGTDYRYKPSRQRTSVHEALIFDSRSNAEHEFKMRRCGRNYEVVEVELKEVTE